jgi:hypothetical protein
VPSGLDERVHANDVVIASRLLLDGRGGSLLPSGEATLRPCRARSAERGPLHQGKQQAARWRPRLKRLSAKAISAEQGQPESPDVDRGCASQLALTASCARTEGNLSARQFVVLQPCGTPWRNR